MTQATATQIAADVRAGRVQARAVVEAALARLDEARHLDAAEHVLADEARSAAHALDSRMAAGEDVGPLAGVPVVIKAENDVAGVVTTFGGRCGGEPAVADSAVVARLRQAGAVVVATTRMPEFGQYPFTEGDGGITRNPHDLDRSPGGSSGGSAALVAAGVVPVGIGGDGGGSIRIPASCCGLVGLKPVRGRVSTAPHPDLWGALGTIGPLTGTVADCALVYDAISGTTDVDAFSARAPTEPFAAAAAREPGRLRIGWIATPPWPTIRVDPRVRRVLGETARRLAEAGHDVRALPGRWPDAQPAFVPSFFAAIADECSRVPHPERAEARTRSGAGVGAAIPDVVLRAAGRAAERIRRGVEARWAEYDVVLSPTIACLPPPLPQLTGAWMGQAILRAAPMVAFSTLANVTGHTAMSIAAGTAGALPVGVQLYAPGGDETRLLPLAAQLERLLRDAAQA
ncbi:amidase family protein [Mobilicoccus sp.]|uniref:amidase family protein n=1 Tax=Mobilicoccus sp. TaxID=2034349 RepID=UPI0028B243FC|nr:amidase family protein [Mobilicoccus sp.]